MLRVEVKPELLRRAYERAGLDPAAASIRLARTMGDKILAPGATGETVGTKVQDLIASVRDLAVQLVPLADLLDDDGHLREGEPPRADVSSGGRGLLLVPW